MKQHERKARNDLPIVIASYFLLMTALQLTYEGASRFRAQLIEPSLAGSRLANRRIVRDRSIVLVDPCCKVYRERNREISKTAVHRTFSIRYAPLQRNTCLFCSSACQRLPPIGC